MYLPASWRSRIYFTLFLFSVVQPAIISSQSSPSSSSSSSSSSPLSSSSSSSDSSSQDMRQLAGKSGAAGRPDSTPDSKSSVGGIRSLAGGQDKRGWKDNTMQVWGKRSGGGGGDEHFQSENGHLVAGSDIIDRENFRNPDANNEKNFAHSVDGKEGKGGEGAGEGDRVDDHYANAENTKRRWGDNSMQVWGKRQSARKYRSVDGRVGGDYQRLSKQGGYYDENGKWLRKAGHSNSVAEPAKRKWGDNNAAMRGKRAAEGTLEEIEKRKWGDNSMSVWGKRSHPHLPNHFDEEEQMNEFDQVKRKWGDNSMSVWGKRSEAEKRKWGDNSVAVWGKRSVADEAEKRKWGENSMSVWGKRSEIEPEKRKWGDNSMSVWGKRGEFASGASSLSQEEGSPATPVGGRGKSEFAGEKGAAAAADEKRKWGENSMQVWGKRASEIAAKIAGDDAAISRSSSHSISKRSLDDGDDEEKEIVRGGAAGDDGDEEEEGEGDEEGEGGTVSNMEHLWQTLYKRTAAAAQNRLANLKTFGSLVQETRGPKRNWETNTMRVWGKRGGIATPSRALLGVTGTWRGGKGNLHGQISGRQRALLNSRNGARHPFLGGYEEEEEREEGEEDEVEGGEEGRSRKRAWSGDNGMRVWG